jgi:hypothetical protein
MVLAARPPHRSALAAGLGILPALTLAVPQRSSAAPEPGVVMQQSGDRLTLENGYTHLEFDLAHPQIDVVRADFKGQGNYGSNLAATGNGIVLERHDVFARNVVNSIGITATLPGHGTRDFTVHRLAPGTVYLVQAVKANGALAMRPIRATVGDDGVLCFTAPVGPGLRVEARRLGPLNSRSTSYRRPGPACSSRADVFCHWCVLMTLVSGF